MDVFNEKFQSVLSDEGVVSIVTWANNNANVSNTWNSYLKITEDGRILIPAAGMKKTEANVNLNKNIKVTLGSKKVQGLWGLGTGFLLEGTAEFIYDGQEYQMIKEQFPFMNRVLAITIDKIYQTV